MTENVEVAKGGPHSVLFYGLGFPSEQYSGHPIDEDSDRLYYTYLEPGVLRREQQPTVSEETVFRAVREAQEEIYLWFKCQDMSAAEIGTVMSRDFSDGWLDILEMILELILKGARRWAVGGDCTLSSVLFPPKESPKEDMEISCYDYYVTQYNSIQNNFNWFYKLFLESHQEKSAEFKQGGVNALRLQRRRFEEVMQGEIRLVDSLKMVTRDILAISREREKAFEGEVLIPRVLTMGYFKETPQLMTFLFDEDHPPESEGR
ncbi:MAG: hypothetical protein ACFFC6_11720 [Promethearchaeota archaeon]